MTNVDRRRDDVRRPRRPQKKKEETPATPFLRDLNSPMTTPTTSTTTLRTMGAKDQRPRRRRRQGSRKLATPLCKLYTARPIAAFFLGRPGACSSPLSFFFCDRLSSSPLLSPSSSARVATDARLLRLVFRDLPPSISLPAPNCALHEASFLLLRLATDSVACRWPISIPQPSPIALDRADRPGERKEWHKQTNKQGRRRAHHRPDIPSQPTDRGPINKATKRSLFIHRRRRRRRKAAFLETFFDTLFFPPVVLPQGTASPKKEEPRPWPRRPRRREQTEKKKKQFWKIKRETRKTSPPNDRA